MNVLDEYLRLLNDEEPVNEIAPLVAGAAMTLPLVIMFVATLIKETKQSLRHSKVDPKLTNQIRDVTGQRKWEVNEVNFLNISNGKPAVDAYAIGGLKTIFISKAMKKMLTEREQVAVCLHEISHTKNLDELVSACVSLGGAIGIVALILQLATKVSLSVVIGLPVLLGVVNCLGYFYLLRRAESRADLYAVKYGYGKDLASALQKLDKLHKKREPCQTKKCKILRKMNLYVQDHPDMEKRLQNITKKESEQLKKEIGPKLSKLREALII